MAMNIQIDLNKLHTEGLTPNEYIYLYLTVNKIPLLSALPCDLEKLQKLGYIKITSEDELVLRSKINKLFTTVDIAGDVDTWIDDWRHIWPDGVKSGGRPVRGTKSECIKKMKAFIQKNKQFSKSDIFAAALAYSIERKRDGYKFMVCADYFINKQDSGSMLEAWCDDMKSRGAKVEDFETPSFNDAI
jgi:hypothetical protein